MAVPTSLSGAFEQLSHFLACFLSPGVSREIFPFFFFSKSRTPIDAGFVTGSPSTTTESASSSSSFHRFVVVGKSTLGEPLFISWSVSKKRKEKIEATPVSALGGFFCFQLEGDVRLVGDSLTISAEGWWFTHLSRPSPSHHNYYELKRT